MKLGYPIQLLGKIKGSTVKSASISLDDYYLVDEAISTLAVNNEKLYDVAAMIYIQDMTYKQVGKVIGKCERTVCSYKKSIVEHTANYLNFKG